MITVLCLALLLFNSPIPQTPARGIVVSGGGGGATYLVNQGFEGSGYDNSETWTGAGTGTVDPDYTTSPAPLVGSQSLRISISSQTGSSFTTFTAQDTVWGYFKFQRVSDGGTTREIATLRNGSTAICTISLIGGHQLNIKHGSTGASTSSATSIGTTYHVWFKYVKGTGSDGFAEVSFSSDGTKPTSGNSYVSVTTGTATTQADRIYIGTTSSRTYESVFDSVRVDDADIGSNPP